MRWACSVARIWAGWGGAHWLTNPKGYPVAVATFTALLAGQSEQLDWAALPPLLGAASCGFLIADVLLVALIGAAVVRRFYRRHELWIVRASGMLFIGFALVSVSQSVPGLLRIRR
jgi:threonine/homoserine/homoserine lactone efflux protein